MDTLGVLGFTLGFTLGFHKLRFSFSGKNKSQPIFSVQEERHFWNVRIYVRIYVRIS
jgi:hypothetical protein